MNVYSVIVCLVGCATLISFLLGLARWIGKIDRNTEATERLTETFDAFAGRIDDRLTDHERRISRLEGWRE